MKILVRLGFFFVAIMCSSVHAVTVQFAANNPITDPAYYTNFSPLPWASYLPPTHTFDGFTFSQINGDGNDISTKYSASTSETSRGWYPNGGDYGYTQITLSSGADFGDTALYIGEGGHGPDLAYELVRDSSVIASGSIPGIQNWTWLTITGGVFDTIRLRSGSEGVYVGIEGMLNTLAFDQVAVASPVPIPPALWLFGSGLLGLVGVSRKKK